MKILGVIPSRYGSTRLPGKPLALIGQRSLVMRVYDQCVKAKSLSEVLVATDDERILNHVNENGGKVILTRTDHISGTDRCAEVLENIGTEFDYIINIQGDEPFIDPAQIEELVKVLDGKTEIATLCKLIETESELFDPGIPKVVFSTSGNALYFSRSTIPFFRNEAETNWLNKGKYYKHIGIYAYRCDVLATLGKLKSSELEKMEQLEQLRWLSNGMNIRVVETKFDSISVDTPQDLEKARKFLLKKMI